MNHVRTPNGWRNAVAQPSRGDAVVHRYQSQQALGGTRTGVVAENDIGKFAKKVVPRRMTRTSKGLRRGVLRQVGHHMFLGTIEEAVRELYK